MRVLHRGGQALLFRGDIKPMTTLPGMETGWNAAIDAEVKTPLGTLRVYVLHLASVRKDGLPGWLATEPRRAQQIASLIQSWQNSGQPTAVILGDFNQLPNTANHAELKKHFTDSLESLGLLTATHDIGFRIDYIFLTPTLTPLHAQVSNSKASDHRPVTLTFTTTQPTP